MLPDHLQLGPTPTPTPTPLLKPAGRQLQSYPWLAPNSCFFDNGLELWYRAFQLWMPKLRTEFFGSLNPNSALASIFYHFRRRAKWEADSSQTDVDGLRELEICQAVLKNYIFHKWQLYEPGTFGCATTWIHHAIKVSHLPGFTG